MIVLIGNIIALIGSLLVLYSGILKNKKKILFVQCIQMSAFTISNFLLGGITGAITNALGVFRNILCYHNKWNKLYMLIITSIMVFLSLYFDKITFISIIPLICVISYNLFMNTKSILKFKILLSFTFILYSVYDLSIRSYTSSLFNFLSFVMSIISIYQILKGKKIEK